MTQPSQPRSTPREPESSLLYATDYSFWLDQGFVWVVRLFAIATVALLLWMCWIVFQQAQPAIQQFGLGFFTSQEWDVGNLVFGALPYIYGTLVSSVLALLLAVPIGVAVALITSEDLVPLWVRSPLAFIVQLLAAIPSVIVGLWGVVVLIPFLQPIQQWLYTHARWFPLFNSQMEPPGPGMLPAGVILAVMVLPTVAAISRESLLALPRELRSASMSLGATRWETIFGVLLPSSFSGIVGAVTLALGRALGETMAVTMVIGNSDQLSFSLLDLGNTIPALIANQFAEAQDPLHIGALMYLALILFGLTLVVNVIAVTLVQKAGVRP